MFSNFAALKICLVCAIYIYIYIYREREREIYPNLNIGFMYVYVACFLDASIIETFEQCMGEWLQCAIVSHMKLFENNTSAKIPFKEDF